MTIKKTVLFFLLLIFLSSNVYASTSDTANKNYLIPENVKKDDFPGYMIKGLQQFLTDNLNSTVKVKVTLKNSHKSISEFPYGSTIKVSVSVEKSRLNGDCIIYILPDTGGYKNVMIYKMRCNGHNDLTGIHSSFFIPRIGQMQGPVKIYAYIPGFGTGLYEGMITYDQKHKIMFKKHKNKRMQERKNRIKLQPKVILKPVKRKFKYNPE